MSVMAPRSGAPAWSGQGAESSLALAGSSDVCALRWCIWHGCHGRDGRTCVGRLATSVASERISGMGL